MQYYVEIYCRKNEKVEKRMGPMGEREAQRVRRGAMINMSDKYSARIVKEGEAA